MTNVINSQYDTPDRVDVNQRLKDTDDELIGEPLSIYPWFRQRLLAGLRPGTLVGDFGCGTGRLLPMLAQQGRQVLGVDLSLEMLLRVGDACREKVSTLGKPTEVVEVQHALSKGGHVFVEADLERFLPQLGKALLLVDDAVNCFNACCFVHPTIPVSAIASCLRAGGRLYLASNVFCSGTLLSGFSGSSIPLDLSSYISCLKPGLEGNMFRHLLNTPQGPVPFQDYVHDLSMFAQAFDDDTWEIQEAVLFPAIGCTYVHPDDRNVDQLFPSCETVSLLAPDSELHYCKIGVVALRR